MQAAQEASSQAVVELEVALREAQVSCELQLTQLAAQQQQMLHAVRSVRTELHSHQQHALVEDMTVRVCACGVYLCASVCLRACMQVSVCCCRQALMCLSIRSCTIREAPLCSLE